MRNAIRTAAIEAQGDVKDFLTAMLLRDCIVTDKYYRQDVATQKEMCWGLLNDITVIYDLAPSEINSRNIFMEFVTAKGLTWAVAMFALASPSILMDHKLSYAVVKLPRLFVQAYNDQDVLMLLWADCFAALASELNPHIDIIRQCFAANSKMMEVINDLCPHVEG